MVISRRQARKELIALQDAENEIATIREDIARVRERGRQIMEISDPEGYQAMQATLGMLTDKIDNLQNMADDKAKQQQVKDAWLCFCNSLFHSGYR